MINTTCKHCRKTLNIPDKHAGQHGTCNHCQKPIIVPLLFNPATVDPAAMGHGSTSTYQRNRNIKYKKGKLKTFTIALDLFLINGLVYGMYIIREDKFALVSDCFLLALLVLNLVAILRRPIPKEI